MVVFYYFVIWTLITLGVGVYFGEDPSDNFDGLYSPSRKDKLASIWMYGLAAIMLSMSVGTLVLLDEDVIEHEEPIYSLFNDRAISGGFLLGINTQDRYFYFKKEGDGFVRGSVNAKGTLVVEGEDEHPYVKWTETVSENIKWMSLAKIRVVKLDNYELHVPTNTIIREFELQ